MSQNPQSKYHHHVPQFLIRNWQGNNGKVWSWNKYERRAAEKLSETIFGEKFANRFVEFDGTKNSKVENDFSLVESDFAISTRLLMEQISSNQIQKNNSTLVGGLHRLFWNMVIRSPMMRSRHLIDETFYSENIARGTKELIASGFKFDFNVEALLKEGLPKENLKNQLHVEAIGEAALKAPSRVYDFGIAVFLPQNVKNSFVLGLNPIAYISKSIGNQPISALPLSPKIAIAPFGSTNTFDVFGIDDVQLRAFNKRVWINCNEIVANNRELLISLSEDR